MTKLHTVAIAATAALAVAAPLAHAAQRTLQLTERQTYFHETDNAPKGPSASDVITIRGTLFAHGKKVGRDAVRCSGDRHCLAKLTLDGGTLVGRGVQHGDVFTVPVVAGTGAFAGARGTIRVAMTRTGSRYTIEVR